ncbi:DUF4158 domain-containing protein [Marininema mesophilum]|uniref:DUF4158 domain-containing protein n=1 Tax=Marininema mesophilum TaxID=1048340 RepID=UPI00115F872E|nr:DUF4158 domain-containing protein [Marininema mesophilum]
MKQQWTKEELIQHFVLLEPEKKLVEAKRTNSQLTFAVLFRYFQQEACFPENTKSDN